MNALKILSSIYVFLIFQINCFAQSDSIEKLGFRNFSYNFKNEVVNILVKSKKGDEDVVKPLIIYFQGSLARPLIINYPNNDNYKYSLAFPFNTDKIVEKYHIAVISKPYIPVIVDIDNLDKNYTYIDSISGKPPINFLKNDNLEYLAKRNIKVLKFLKNLKFINKSKTILIGHSEGSRIAFEVAKKQKSVTHLVYLSGNPFGRYMNITQRIRKSQHKDSLSQMDDAFNFWIKISKNKKINNFQDGGDTYKSWYIYSQPYFEDFLKIKIPVFIGYGTKDVSVAFNDLFYFYTLLNKNRNFYVKPYIGLEHSFYRVKDDNTIDHEISYWDTVIDDILLWLEQE